MGPSPVNNWTEKNKGDSVPQTALQEYVKKYLPGCFSSISLFFQISSYKFKNSSYEAKTRYFDQFQLQLVCTQAKTKLTEYRKNNNLFPFCCGQEAGDLRPGLTSQQCNCVFFISHLSGFLLHVVLFDERLTVDIVTVFE